MRKGLFCLLIVGLVVATSGWSTTVTVNKAGTGGAYTSINAALAAGGTHITITDSETYEEDLILGDNDTIAGGPPITITSDKTGDARPRITPTADCPDYWEAQSSRKHGVQVFSPNSHFSNLIFEGNGDYGAGCMGIIAEGVVVENCLFHPRPGTVGRLGSSIPFIFFGTQGVGVGDPTDGGRQCDNVIIRNCELNGMLSEKDPEPVKYGIYNGYNDGANVGASQLVRMDVYSHDGTSAKIIDVTFENCLVHYSNDLHMFPSNRGDEGGQLIVYLKNCRMDGASKMSIRGRGASVVGDHTIFTRTNQWNHGDGENSAMAINREGGHYDNFGRAVDCIFKNCGSAFSKKAYYGGIHNCNSEGTFTVDHCTFDNCVSGVTVGGTGGGLDDCVAAVTNSIFHNIGYNTDGGTDAAGNPIAATTPYDVPAEHLYKAWYWGLNADPAYFEAIWTAAFNVYHPTTLGYITVQDTLVGTIADEDSRTWETVVEADPSLAVKENVHGSRLDCGTVGADQRVRYLNAVTRGTPIFKNTDPDAEIPYELDPSSPGQGWGARFGSSVVTNVSDWSLYQ